MLFRTVLYTLDAENIDLCNLFIRTDMIYSDCGCCNFLSNKGFKFEVKNK